MTTKIKNRKEKPRRKFRFKMPTSLAIIVGVVIFVTILTWIPHNGFGLTNDMANAHTGDWQSGSLADWQNYIFWDNMPTDNPGLPWGTVNGVEVTWAEHIINTYGLEGYWDESNNQFVTDISTTLFLNGFSDGSSSMFGIFDAIKAMFGGYQDAWDVGLYLIGIYAVVILLMETDTLKDGISSLVKMLGGKPIVLVPVLFVLFSAGGTLFGMQEETLGLIPIIVPVFVVAGFDAPLGLFVAALGTTTGIAASVLDPFSVGIMADGIGATIGDAIVERLFLFILYTSIGATFVTLYARRVSKNPKKSIEADKFEENKAWAQESLGSIEEYEKMSGSQRAALTIFIIVFVWMVFTLLPWTTWFSGLEDNPGWLIFSSLFYSKTLIGEWYFVELAILFFIAAFIIAKLFNKTMSEFLNICLKSLKDMFGVITIIAFSRATSAILHISGLSYGMIYMLAKPDQIAAMSPLAFTMIWLLIFTFMALFIPSTSGLAGITAPLVGGIIGPADSAHTTLLITGILMAYPLAQGVINMFSPTTGLIVIQAEQSRTSYGKVAPVLMGYAATIFIVGVLAIVMILGIEGGF